MNGSAARAWGEALKDLGELFECDQNISTHKLLEMVYKTIKKSKKESKRTTKKKRTIEELLSQNLAISEEIKKLEEDLDEFSLRDWVDMPEEGYG
ncbi:hypothetical protein MSG28_014289 [Choristoneura fumiferana]|uniref:Uncharacterized protein n=1 Tax=Choristoneura fumiferana TaxID=7141 RepID=A0ACC0JGJ5_CHOFU|nr:hypothetical protein MSG28_014289 [Choristoneura fumiferana]